MRSNPNPRSIIEELQHATLQDSHSARGCAKNNADQQCETIDVMKVEERQMITEKTVLLKRALDAEADTRFDRRARRGTPACADWF
jgi:hypothetical protein